MDFIPFELERWQSQWEHRVRYNLSESGVDPMTIAEVLQLDGADPAELLALPMGYSQGNGSDELRAAVAALHPGSTMDNVVVTTGSAEANFLACWSLVEPGDEVAILMPTYMQTWGIVQNLGAAVREIPLQQTNEWQPDPEDIAAAIGAKTKLVIVTNPNNPTGKTLTSSSLEAVFDRAASAGAWVLVDEVYRGSELNSETTPTTWGRYERTIITGSLSKAYGLPGLRIGWVVAPEEFARGVWERHDYTVICPNPAGDYLARAALRQRDAVLRRTRGILNTNMPLLQTFLEGFDGRLAWTIPDAGAICLVDYSGGPSPTDLAEHLRVSHDLLIVPATHFGLETGVRIGYGNEGRELEAALAVLGAGMRELL